MFPNMLCGASKYHRNQRNLKMNSKPLEPMSNLRFQYSVPLDMDPDNLAIGTIAMQRNKLSNKNIGGIKKMANLIHRVTTSCFLNSSSSVVTNFIENNSDYHHDSAEDDAYKTDDYYEDEDDVEYSLTPTEQGGYKTKKEMEMVMLIGEVFETVSYMKNAYINLQDAHCPWNPKKIRLSDVAVVTEFRKLGFLKKRFHRFVRKNSIVSEPTLREVLVPYEAALEKLTKEVKNKATENNNLRYKLKSATKSGRKHRSHRVTCSSQFQSPPPSPSPSLSVSNLSFKKMEASELFEACMNSVKEASRTFAALLLSLMKSAHWDIAATVKSITGTTRTTTTAVVTNSLESYVNRKIFEGFCHESFNMDDGNISSHLSLSQYRSECFTQYTYMKSVDPMELLRIISTCLFGKFCLNRYLSIMHPKMEISLLRDLEQRHEVLAGNHPRSQFYNKFLGVAKAVWLLHLVSFSLDPLPSYFEGCRGAEFHPEYMETAVEGRVVDVDDVVGFPVSPGFKFGSGYVVKAKVYLVSKSEL